MDSKLLLIIILVLCCFVLPCCCCMSMFTGIFAFGKPVVKQESQSVVNQETKYQSI